jgi:hypothetical protein
MQSEVALHEGGNRLVVRFEDGVLRKIDQNLSLSYCFLHPEVLGQSNRVYMFKMKKPNTYSQPELIMLVVNFFELRLAEDYAIHDVWILDLANFTLNDSLKVTPTIIVKTLAIYEVAYPKSPFNPQLTMFTLAESVFTAPENNSSAQHSKLHI